MHHIRWDKARGWKCNSGGEHAWDVCLTSQYHPVNMKGIAFGFCKLNLVLNKSQNTPSHLILNYKQIYRVIQLQHGKTAFLCMDVNAKTIGNLSAGPLYVLVGIAGYLRLPRGFCTQLQQSCSSPLVFSKKWTLSKFSKRPQSYQPASQLSELPLPGELISTFLVKSPLICALRNTNKPPSGFDFHKKQWGWISGRKLIWKPWKGGGWELGTITITRWLFTKTHC